MVEAADQDLRRPSRRRPARLRCRSRRGLRPRAVGRAGRGQPARPGHPRGGRRRRVGLRRGRRPARGGRPVRRPGAARGPLWCWAPCPSPEFGSAEQQEKYLLPPVAAGELMLTAALIEAGTEPERPDDHGPGRRRQLGARGSKTCVAAGTMAGRDPRAGDGRGRSRRCSSSTPSADGLAMTPAGDDDRRSRRPTSSSSGVRAAPTALGEPADRARRSWPGLTPRATSAMCSHHGRAPARQAVR